MSLLQAEFKRGCCSGKSRFAVPLVCFPLPTAAKKPITNKSCSSCKKKQTREKEEKQRKPKAKVSKIVQSLETDEPEKISKPKRGRPKKNLAENF